MRQTINTVQSIKENNAACNGDVGNDDLAVCDVEAVVAGLGDLFRFIGIPSQRSGTHDNARHSRRMRWTGLRLRSKLSLTSSKNEPSKLSSIKESEIKESEL